MSFVSPQELRKAIDDADHAIQQAVDQGNVVEVIKDLEPQLTKIFQAMRSGSFKNEFTTKRFLVDCCLSYKKALKSGNFDNDVWVEDQRKALSVFLANNAAAAPSPAGSAIGPQQPVMGTSRQAPERIVAEPSRVVTVAPKAVHPAASSAPTAAATSAPAPGAPAQQPVAGPSTYSPAIWGQPTRFVGSPTPMPKPPRPSAPAAAPRKKPVIPMISTGNTTGQRIPPKHSKRARKDGPPTDQLANLSIGGKEDTPAGSRPARRLGSLEEMAVDEDPRVSKRKRESDYVGSDELEEDEEQKRAKARVKRQADDSAKRSTSRTGIFNDPPCERCRKRGEQCEQHAKGLSCWTCYLGKTKCNLPRAGRNTTAPRNPRRPKKQERKLVVESEDSQSEQEKAGRNAPAPRNPPRPKKQERKLIVESEDSEAEQEKARTKGKAKATYTDHEQWQAEEVEAEQLQRMGAERLMVLEAERLRVLEAERRADKEQIKELKERVVKLEEELGAMKEMKKAMWVLERKFGKADEGLGWIEDRQGAVEERVSGIEHQLGNQGVGSWLRAQSSISSLSSAPSRSLSPAPGPSRSASAPHPPSSPLSSEPGKESDAPIAPRMGPMAAPLTPPVPSRTAPPPPATTSIPQVHVIPATPQSSQTRPESQMRPPPSTSPASQPCPDLPSMLTAPKRSTPPPLVSQSPATLTPPPPPWEESVHHDHDMGLLPSSQSLLAPPALDLPKPRSPRRARTRTPSPGPSRRSPRLNSPAPDGPAPPGEPTVVDAAAPALMDIDK